MNWKLTIGAFLLLLTACEQQGSKSKADVLSLEVMTLAAHNISVPEEYVCEISAVQFVEIRARVQGYLEEIYIDEGQSVKKGQPLFRLSSNEYKEVVTSAEANLRRAIAEAKTKTLETDRIRLMVDKKIISSTELEVAMAQKDAAESGVLEAQSTLENARINLGYTFIRAPFDGIVDRIPFKKGSLINEGSLLTSMSNIDEVYAYFKVSETEYLQFIENDIDLTPNGRHKQAVSLILADGSEYPHDGFVETMEGDFDRSTGSIAFRARFRNPEKIMKHGSSGKIMMDKEWTNAVLVPQESTFTIQDKYYVFVLDDQNKARSKNFTTLEKIDEYFIAGGLKQGDRILLEGIQQVRDGMTVSPKSHTSSARDSVNLTTQLQ